MSKTQMLFLDSDNAIQLNGSPSDLIFSLNFNTGNDMSGYALSIQSISVPNMVYPLNSQNNKFYFIENGGSTLTGTLTENNYTGDQFATELETQLNASGTLTYTVSYDSQNKKISFSVPLPDTFQLVDGDNNCYAEWGINISTSDLSAHISDYPVYLAGSQYIDIQMDISTKNYASNGKTNIFERIPLNASFGVILYYQNTTDDYIHLNEESIDTLEIRILNDKGKLWELPPNAQLTIVCKLSQFL